MTTNNQNFEPDWQIYELGGPGPHFPRWVVARNLGGALRIAVQEDDRLDAGIALVVWNRTAEFMQSGHAMRLQTAAMLNEAREGLVYYDRRVGWERV